MTSAEIEELKEKVNKVGCMEACIRAAEGNIESYNRVFGGNEISIQNHTNRGNAIYLSGTMKTKIYELLLEEQNNIIDKYKLQLENLK